MDNNDGGIRSQSSNVRSVATALLFSRNCGSSGGCWETGSAGNDG